MGIKVTEDYGTHQYNKKYDLDPDMCCPNCGEWTVYCETGSGDYYVGVTHVCISCDSAWTIQGPRDAGVIDLQVIKQIKKSVSPG